MSLRGIVWLFNDYTDPQEALVHGNAPMTPRGRIIMIERIAAGRPIAHVAAEMGLAQDGRQVVAVPETVDGVYGLKGASTWQPG